MGVAGGGPIPYPRGMSRRPTPSERFTSPPDTTTDEAPTTTGPSGWGHLAVSDGLAVIILAVAALVVTFGQQTLGPVLFGPSDAGPLATTMQLATGLVAFSGLVCAVVAAFAAVRALRLRPVEPEETDEVVELRQHRIEQAGALVATSLLVLVTAYALQFLARFVTNQPPFA